MQIYGDRVRGVRKFPNSLRGPLLPACVWTGRNGVQAKCLLYGHDLECIDDRDEAHCRRLNRDSARLATRPTILFAWLLADWHI